MIYFIELWNAKPEWLALSQQERADYMAQIGPHIGGLLEKGVEILTWSENDPSTSKRADYDFFAIWKFPDEATANDFQNLVEGAGWYNYFEQTNIQGATNSVENVISSLVQL